MVIYLALSTTAKLNYFPSKYGLSRYYSPKMLLHRRNLNFKKHCQFSFGAYVQAYNENQRTNTLQERSINCIYLRPTTSWQGGHESLNISTNKIITRSNIIELPITKTIIDQIKQIAKNENMPIEFNSKFKDNIWFAGVDNNNEDNKANNKDNEANNEDSQEEESDMDNEMFRDEIMNEINIHEPYQTKNYQTNKTDDRESEIHDMQEYQNDHEEISNEEKNELDLYDHQEEYDEHNNDYNCNNDNNSEMNDQNESIETIPNQLETTENTCYDFDDLSFNELINLEEIDQDTDQETENDSEIEDTTKEGENSQDQMKESRINWYTTGGRPIKTPQRYINWAIPIKSELQREEYREETAQIIGKVMCHLQQKTKKEWNFSSKHYSLKQGIKRFELKATYQSLF